MFTFQYEKSIEIEKNSRSFWWLQKCETEIFVWISSSIEIDNYRPRDLDVNVKLCEYLILLSMPKKDSTSQNSNFCKQLTDQIANNNIANE